MADLFRTTADQEFNSFQDPLNPFNTTQGNWSIDPTYLTPSYAAPYRQQYQGYQGAPLPTDNVGFFEGFRNVYTPWGVDRPYGDSVTQEDPYFSSLTTRPADAMAWAGQRVIIPALAFYAGMKASEMAVKSNSQAYSSVMKAARMIGGMSASVAAAKSAKMGVGARIGSSVFQGATSGFLKGIGAPTTGTAGSIASKIVGGAGLIGAGVGSIATPFLVGEAGIRTLNATVFDPYSATRRTDRMLRSDFANVMAGSGLDGNTIDGFGMSRSFSARLSNKLTHHSIGDMMLNTDDMGQLADYAARSGMLDDAQLSQIEGRMKTITKQVKVMMRVANEPDFKAAMEMLAELKTAGAGENIAGRVMHRIGSAAAVAGVSAQQVMNTVGAQGQFLYQANNLTPYLGQIHAANTYGAFSSAYRMGLISDSTMAQFGGREGITQLAMTAQVNAAQTPYNQIMLMNQYMHGGQSGSVVGNLSQMGVNAAQDPIAAAGALQMYGRDMASRQLMEKGSSAMLDQISQIADTIPGMKNEDGTVDVEKAYVLMTKQMGLNDMEARAALKELYVAGQEGALSQSRAATAGKTQKDVLKALEQEGLGYGPLTGLVRGTRRAWKNAKQDVSDVTNSVTEGLGYAADSIQRKYYHGKYGRVIDEGVLPTFEEFSGLSTGEVYQAQSKSPALQRLNRLARGGNEEARKALLPTTPREERVAAISRLARGGELGISESSVSSVSKELFDKGSAAVPEGDFTSKVYELEGNYSANDQLDWAVSAIPGVKIMKGYFNTGRSLLGFGKPEEPDKINLLKADSVLKQLSTLAKSGDKEAMIAVNPNLSEEERTKAMDSLNVKRKLGTDQPLSSKELTSMNRHLINAKATEVGVTGDRKKLDDVEKGLRETLGKDLGVVHGVEAVEAARRVAVNPEDEESAKLLRKLYGEDMSKTDLWEKASEITKASAKNEVAHLTGIMANQSADQIMAESSKKNAKKVAEIKAKHLSPEEEKRQIEALAFLSRAKDTNINPSAGIDKKLYSDDLTAQNVSDLTEAYREVGAKSLQDTRLADQKVINFDTKYSMMASTQLEKAVSQFGEFVNKLDEVARKFEKAAGPGSAIPGLQGVEGRGFFGFFNGKGGSTGE